MLVTVSGPDPKLVKTELTSNSSAKDGQTRFSSTGKLLINSGVYDHTPPLHLPTPDFVKISKNNSFLLQV